MASRRELTRYPVPLTSEFIAVLSLPHDLSAAEADRLCDFIQTLPIPVTDERDEKERQCG